MFITGSGGSLWSNITTAAGGSWTQETSSIARTGKCIKAVCPANLAHNIRGPTAAADFPTNVGVARFYVRFEALPTGAAVTLAFISSSGSFHFFVYDPATGFFGHQAGVSAVVLDTVTVVVGRWYRVDMKLNINGTPVLGDCKVEGRDLAQSSVASAAGTISALCFGTSKTTEPAHTFYVDDSCMSATAADYPIGPGHVKLILPGSDGTHSFTAGDFKYGDAGTNIATSATDVNTMVGDVVPWTATRSTTDNVAQVVIRTTGYVEVAPQAIAEPNIANGVQTRLAYSSPSASPADTGGCIVRTSAGFAGVLFGDLPAAQGGGAGALTDYSESTNFFTRKMVTAPGAGWTQTEVNAIRWRMGGSNDIAPVPTWQALMLEVDYPDRSDVPDISRRLTSRRGVRTVKV